MKSSDRTARIAVMATCFGALELLYRLAIAPVLNLTARLPLGSLSAPGRAPEAAGLLAHATGAFDALEARWRPYHLGQYALSVTTAVALFAGGVMVLRGRERGVRLILRAFVTAIPLELLSSSIDILYAIRQGQILNEFGPWVMQVTANRMQLPKIGGSIWGSLVASQLVVQMAWSSAKVCLYVFGLCHLRLTLAGSPLGEAAGRAEVGVRARREGALLRSHGIGTVSGPPLSGWARVAVVTDLVASVLALLLALAMLGGRVIDGTLRPGPAVIADSVWVVGAALTAVADVLFLSRRPGAALAAFGALVTALAGVLQGFAAHRGIQMFIPDEAVRAAYVVVASVGFARLLWFATYLLVLALVATGRAQPRRDGGPNSSSITLTSGRAAPAPIAGAPVSPSARTAGYDVFISYSHRADARVAKQLQTSLQRFARPLLGGRSIRAFRDDDSLPMTADLWGSIGRTLDRCAFFVLLACPTSARSPWVAREVDHFLRTNGVGRFGIVLTDGLDPWIEGREVVGTEACAISESLYALLERTPPLIIDLRPFRVPNGRLHAGGEAYLERVASIVAAVRSRPKDEVYGEHLRRQRQQILFLTALTGVLILSLAVAVAETVEAAQRGDQARRELRRVTAYRLTVQAASASDKDPALASLLAAESVLVTRRAHDPPVAPAWQALAAITSSSNHGFGLVAHRAPVRRLALDSQANRLATMGDDGAVFLWDVATSEPPAKPTLLAPPRAPAGGDDEIAPETSNWVYDLAFDSSRRWVLWTNHEGEVHAASVGRDVTDHRLISRAGSTTTGKFDWIFSVTPSPDPDRIIVLSQSGLLTVHSIEQRTKLFERHLGLRPTDSGLKQGQFVVIGARVDDDSHSPFEASGDGSQLALWRGHNGGSEGALEKAGCLEHGLREAILLGSTSIAAVDERGTLFVVDLRPAETKREPKPLATDVSGVWATPSGRQMLVRRADGIEPWTRGDDDEWRAAPRRLPAYEGVFTASLDELMIAVGASDGSVTLWQTSDERPPERRRLHGDEITALAFVDRHLVSSSMDGTTRVSPLEASEVAPVDSTLLDASPSVTAMITAEDGAPVAALAGHELRALRGPHREVARPADGQDVVDLADGGLKAAQVSGEYVVSFNAKAKTPEPITLVDAHQGMLVVSAVAHPTDVVDSATVTPDGRLVFYTQRDGQIRIHDRRSPAADAMVPQALPYKPLTDGWLTTSPDGRWVANKGYGSVLVSVASPYSSRTSGPSGGHSTLAVAFSPDSRYFAISTSRGAVKLWDLKPSSGPHELARLKTPDLTWIYHLRFTHDSGRLVAAGDDGALRVWSVRTFDPFGSLRTMRGHEKPITSLDLDASGRALTASEDGTVRLWPLDGDGEALIIGRHEGRVHAARFSGPAHFITADGSGVHLWPSPEQPHRLERACTIAGRNLSEDEWERYLPSIPFALTCPQYPSLGRRRTWTWTHD